MNWHQAPKLALIAWFAVVTPVSASAGDGEASIGKLFTDPQDRGRMELYRRGEKEKEVVEKPSITNVRIDGLMMRSDGENVIWVNGEDTLEVDRVNGIETYPESVDKKNLDIPVKVDGRLLRIKPGQQWSESSGEVRDSY